MNMEIIKLNPNYMNKFILVKHWYFNHIYCYSSQYTYHISLQSIIYQHIS